MMSKRHSSKSRSNQNPEAIPPAVMRVFFTLKNPTWLEVGFAHSFIYCIQGVCAESRRNRQTRRLPFA